ncbi:MAG TPA: hypothetical protein VG455_05545 [Acidimicrobiales bacterium]|nr:hypothetical protein [Acidimicrobiales bacterium]
MPEAHAEAAVAGRTSTVLPARRPPKRSAALPPVKNSSKRRSGEARRRDQPELAGGKANSPTATSKVRRDRISEHALVTGRHTGEPLGKKSLERNWLPGRDRQLTYAEADRDGVEGGHGGQDERRLGRTGRDRRSHGQI